MVLRHGYFELSPVELVATGIEGRHGEVDGSFDVVQEGVEVELLLRGSDVELHILLAVDAAKACRGIEGAGTAGVVELHLLDVRWYIVGDDEAAECYDTVQGDAQVERFFANGHLAIAEEGVGIACGVGELDLRDVSHCGVGTAAVSHDHQLVGSLCQLEGALSECGIAGDLTD